MCNPWITTTTGVVFGAVSSLSDQEKKNADI
jgi:hypothetical protein